MKYGYFTPYASFGLNYGAFFADSPSMSMRHVKEIRTIIGQGQYGEAHEALDNLLTLGPGNIEALKLKCMLFEQEGRFVEEAKVWTQVISRDPEDLDALYFFQRRHLEERESFFFTDQLPGGGRRFLAHPRAIINASLIGLAGCILFLVFSHYTRQIFFLNLPLVSLISFAFLVFAPWVLIIVCYFRSIKDILVTHEGIRVATRLRKISLRWDEIDQVYLAHTPLANPQKLSLVFQPREQGKGSIEINLSQETSIIRARACFLNEVSRLFREPMYVQRRQLPSAGKKSLSF